MLNHGPSALSIRRIQLSLATTQPAFMANPGSIPSSSSLTVLCLTGKRGPWNLGFLVADDRSPGLIVPPGDPSYNQRAHFAIGRVSHDLGEQSSIGAMYTDREFNGTFNRVGGLDGTFRLDKNWSAQYRGYMSSTLDSTGYSFGQHQEGVLVGTGRRFTF